MKETIKKIFSKSWIYILLLVIMVFAVSVKSNYQMDEIYSYGLANNVGQTSVHPLWAPFTYDNPAEPFLDYMVVEEGEPFSIANVWYNQERESSPPFYYLAVYLVCFWFKERFTRWSAALVNLVFITLAMVMFRKILQHFEIRGRELDLYSIFFMISPAIINNVVLFRMYTMFLFAALFLTWVILHYRNQENWKFYVLMILGSVFGVLTHYYMIFFVFFLSLVYGISLLIKKEWKKAGIFVGSMALAGGLAYIIFPGMIHHLFVAGRGAEGIQNLQGGAAEHMEHLRAYIGIIDREFFGYHLSGFLIFLLALLVLGIILQKKRPAVREEKAKNPDRAWDWLILFLPSALYIVMIAKVAPYRVDRYIMGTFGFILMAFLFSLKKLLTLCFGDKRALKNITMVVICAVTLVNILQVFKISYLYLGDREFLEEMENYSDVDALCVTSAGWRISGNFNDMIKLGSLTFFQNEIETLDQMEELKSKDEFLLYVVDNDPQPIIDRIFEICPQLTSCDDMGKADVAQLYHLYAE